MNETKCVTASRARVIGDQVFLDHFGHDVVVWRMQKPESAEFVAARINDLLGELRTSLAESNRLASEYARWSEDTIRELEDKVRETSHTS